MADPLMEAIVDWGVLTKEIVFGIIALTMGVLLMSGFIDLHAAIISHAAHRGGRVRFALARALLKIGVVIVMVEPLLQVLGVPDLPLLDWHVLLLICGSILACAGAIGVLFENPEYRRRNDE